MLNLGFHRSLVPFPHEILEFLWVMEKCGLSECVATWEHSWLGKGIGRAVSHAQSSDRAWSWFRGSQCFHQWSSPAAPVCKSDFPEKAKKPEINLLIRTNIRLFYELAKIDVASTGWGMSKVALWESSWRWQWVPQGAWDSSSPSEKSKIRPGHINKVFVRHLMWSCCI